MSEPLLNVMKIMLLAGLYLFFIRVLWSVFSELRDPRTVARKRAKTQATNDARADGLAASSRRPVAMHEPALPSNLVGGAQSMAMAAGTAMAAVAGRLTVTEPPQTAGTQYALGREITMGRAATNGIVLDDTYVSTVHARIFQTNGTYFIEDLSSRNGSSLNGMALIATTALVPGDRLQVGATAMEFS